MLSVCTQCGKPESRDRCCWPMPDSPLSFFGPETWLDDDAIDREIEALRLNRGDFTTQDLADTLGISVKSVWTLISRGQIPRPGRREVMETSRGGLQECAMWTPEQVAGVLLERGREKAAV